MICLFLLVVPFSLTIGTIFFSQIYQAELLSKEDGDSASDFDDGHEISEDATTTDNELRKTLANILIDNVKLRKQLNSVLHHALKTDISNKDDGSPPEEMS